MKTFFTILIKFSCVLFLVSCFNYKPTSNFKRILNDSQSKASGKLNFEGAYLNDTDTNYLAREAIYFFKNGLLFYHPGLANEEWCRKYLYQMPNWGTYEIMGDTINICVYYYYLQSHGTFRQTNFSGVIKNRDTILNWHIIEPYPKMPERFKFTEKYAFLRQPKNLYFTPVTFKPFMDSVSEKARILKYRDKN